MEAVEEELSAEISRQLIMLEREKIKAGNPAFIRLTICAF